MSILSWIKGKLKQREMRKLEPDKDFETTNLDSDIEDFNNIDDEEPVVCAQENETTNNVQDTQKSERKYFVNIDDDGDDEVDLQTRRDVGLQSRLRDANRRRNRRHQILRRVSRR